MVELTEPTMSVIHFTAIAAFLGAILALVACDGVTVTPSRVHGGHGGGDAGTHGGR
jgi:putative copper export protein